MYQKTYHIHFVGIGGIGMSGIAELLLNLGYEVSGSDLKGSEITRRLEGLGGRIHLGHAAENVGNADVVVTSSAIREHNPEVVAARQAAVPVIPRAEMLAELMRLKYSIAIAGAHGKTSTTSLVAAVLAAGGLDPTVVIGGKLKSIDANALLGQGEFIVAEADESDGSFLKFSPTIAVVTNIDEEHLDYYADIEEIKASFQQFLDRIPFYGLAVVCLDDEHVQEILPKMKKRVTTYGLSSQADFQAKELSFEGLRTGFTVHEKGQKRGRITLNLPGVHNVYNALASIAVGMELGIPYDTIKGALETIAGVRRRIEIKGEAAGVVVVDDYGHHPTEIKRTLQALDGSWPDLRKIVVFQPHRYTRTAALFNAFTRAFYQSDVLIVLPIYAAGEDVVAEVSARRLCEGITAHGHKNAVYADSFDEAAHLIEQVLAPGDVLLTLGAGDVWQVGERALKRLQERGDRS